MTGRGETRRIDMTREQVLGLLSLLRGVEERSSRRSALEALVAAWDAGGVAPRGCCGVPECPCNDGDPCNYEDLPGSPAMPREASRIRWCVEHGMQALNGHGDAWYCDESGEDNPCRIVDAIVHVEHIARGGGEPA